MKIYFYTNLDEAQNDVFQLNYNHHIDTNTHPVPRVGERLEFTFEKYWEKRQSKFELEVVGVNYDYAMNTVRVELYIPSNYKYMSIDEWTNWFNKHRFNKDWQ